MTRRTEVIQIRVTAEEKAQLGTIATANNLSVSDLLRNRALGIADVAATDTAPRSAGILTLAQRRAGMGASDD